MKHSLGSKMEPAIHMEKGSGSKDLPSVRHTGWTAKMEHAVPIKHGSVSEMESAT